MIKYAYNEAIKFLEIDPMALSDGLDYAEKNGYEALRIRCLNHNSAKRYTVDFSEFTDRKFITRLIIGDSFRIDKSSNTEALYTLCDLEYLSVEQPIRLDLSHLCNLTTLYITGDSKVENISALANLKHLLLRSTAYKDLHHLTALRNLEILRIVGGGITSLLGIESFYKLERLDLLYCRRLIDITSISMLASLKDLHIEKCGQVADLCFLQNNQSIRKLFVEKVLNLSFITSMSDLEKFSFWNCIDGNMEPLTHTPSQVYFYPNKRHYSHTLEQINKIRVENGVIR